MQCEKEFPGICRRLNTAGRDSIRRVGDACERLNSGYACRKISMVCLGGTTSWSQLRNEPHVKRCARPNKQHGTQTERFPPERWRQVQRNSSRSCQCGCERERPILDGVTSSLGFEFHVGTVI